jgi:hypothetical protein
VFEFKSGEESMMTRSERLFHKDEAALSAAYDAKIKQIDDDVAAGERDLAQWFTVHQGAWGFDDSDRRRIDSRPQYEAVERALYARVRPVRARLEAQRCEREWLVRERTERLHTLRQTRPFFGPIEGLELQLPSEAADSSLDDLRAERRVIEDARDTAMREAESLGDFLAEDQRHAASVKVRHQHKLATGDELKAAEARAKSTEKVMAAARDRVEQSERELADIDGRMEARCGEIHRARQQHIARELPGAASAAADAVYAALRAMTRLKRLRRASDGTAPFWTMPTLDADDPRCEGLEFLERLEQDGWTPTA